MMWSRGAPGGMGRRLAVRSCGVREVYLLALGLFSWVHFGLFAAMVGLISMLV